MRRFGNQRSNWMSLGFGIGPRHQGIGQDNYRGMEFPYHTYATANFRHVLLIHDGEHAYMWHFRDFISRDFGFIHL